MDPIEIQYESMSAVPEAFKSLYTEKDGKAVLTGVNGLKTVQDVNNVQEALRKEREDHAKVRNLLNGWKALGDDPSALQAKLDKMAELEAAAAGKLDDAKLNQLVEARIGQKTAPLERQLRELTEAKNTLESELASARTALERRDLSDAIRTVATEMKVLPTAIPDVELIAGLYLERDATSGEFIVKSDAKGATPGGDIRTFLKDMQKARPHWWPASQGGGAGGGGGFANVDDNPWSAKGWNLTKQGQYIKEHGMAKAEAAAKAVGSRIGATGPAKTK